ncbi:MAG: hypothetical protein JWL96_500 [Sphingomonas bacterium]|uniref:hypothetical protein n=1 Tax=Sphingomonas bacterium TaxID=1895847 RepID=UPI0026279481|nr:hypothetical protein [Sphingomonas bacterium]MDB5708430.1 hypothetical protein [Sphingomonas bacterium]
MRAAFSEVEAVARGKNVQMDAVHRQRAFRIRLGNVRMGDVRAIDGIDRAGADHPEMIALDEDRRVLVDADAEDARILRDRATWGFPYPLGGRGASNVRSFVRLIRRSSRTQALE